MVDNLRMQDWITYMLQGGNFWAKTKVVGTYQHVI